MRPPPSQCATGRRPRCGRLHYAHVWAVEIGTFGSFVRKLFADSGLSAAANGGGRTAAGGNGRFVQTVSVPTPRRPDGHRGAGSTAIGHGPWPTLDRDHFT